MSEPAPQLHPHRCIVVVPTYNERENLPLLINRISHHAPLMHVLIVDDNSPDGTGLLADDLSIQSRGSVHVLHRPTKDGLGPAYLAGFQWALAHDYDTILQMDADLSHDPAFLPEFLAAIQHCDLVLGSRYLGGIRVVN